MRKQQKIINLYEDDTVQSVKQVVSIADEEDLNQFWEYIITFHAVSEADVYSFFLSLYELSARFLEESDGIFFEIIIEKSCDSYYFTIWNRYFVEFARQVLNKRHIEHRFDEKRISIRMLKTLLEEQHLHKNISENERVISLLSTVSMEPSHKQYVPYDFIDSNDLKELIELTEDLSELLLEIQKKGFNTDVFIRMRSFFSMISMTLNYYPQIEEIATVMTEISVLINQHKDEVAAMSASQIALIEGFVHNFERWLRVLFVEGGAELYFMNRSLRADVEMIRAMIEPVGCEEDIDLDAIFDF